MADQPVQGWALTVSGHRHRVEVTGSWTRTVTWHVDDQLVAAKRSSDDTVRLSPGDRLEKGTDTPDERPDLGALAVTFTGTGRPKRATWFRADGDVPATARALVGAGGIDLVPDPGSPAARREEQIQLHPRRHTALAVAKGVATVVVPLLLGLLAVRLAVRIPWPDWDLPSIPWPDVDLPDVDLPSIPWPDVDLPDWQRPGWLDWLLDKAGFVWPVVLAWVLARREVRRRREQAALRAQLAAEAASGGAGRTAPDPALPPAHGPPADGDDRTEDGKDDGPADRRV